MFVMGPKVTAMSLTMPSGFGIGMFVMGPKDDVQREIVKNRFGIGMFVMGPKERGNYSKPD